VRRRPVVPRRALIPLAAAGLLVLSACTKGRERADSSAPAARPGARSALVGATPAPAPQLPGALAKPVADYTPDEFYTFVHALAFGGGADRTRKCKGNPACATKGGKVTSARVDAVDGQDSLVIGTLPANGVVAVRARNTGELPEARYGLLPGAYEYYVIVTRTTDTTASWSLAQLGITPGARTLAQVGSGTFHPCNHPFTKGKYRANFYTCADSHMASDSTTMRMGLQLDDAISDPIWMKCSYDCCIVT